MAAHVAANALTRPGAPALRFEDRSWSYADLDSDAARAANAFRALGITAGDRIAILLPNIPAFVIAYLGAVRLGAIAVSISTAWQSAAAALAIADATPRLLVTTLELHEQLAVEGASPDSARRVVVSEGPDHLPSEVEDWNSLLQRASPSAPVHPVVGSDAAAILYTSGTSGEPKGVVLSHLNVRFTAESKARYCGFRMDEKVALVVPLFHCYGQNALLMATFAAGGCVVLQRRFDAAAIVRSAHMGELTSLLGVPPVLSRLLEIDDSEATSALRRLRYVFSAATTLPLRLAQEWRERFGHTVHEGYGLTESSPFAAYNHLDRYVPGALGAPIEQVEMEVVDIRDGERLRCGELGEIVIRGPNLMLGYWRRPEATGSAVRAGWLHTGDLGVRDEAGYYHLRDRLQDLVKVGGFRVLPSAVEAVLQSHASVRESVAYGKFDNAKGESLEAAVVCMPGRHASEPELIAHCSTRLASYEVPTRIHLREELPRNTTGKVSRRMLRASTNAGTAAGRPLTVES